MSQALVGRQRRRPKKADKGQDTPALTRDAIVEAAIKLLDGNDLENFSMRNLAKELGVYPTAIYWHIPSRNAVIAAVISEIMNNLTPPPSDDWKEWLTTLFRNYRGTIKRHPNISPLIGVQLVSNASVDLDLIEGILRALVNAGFPKSALPVAYNVVQSAMVGFTTEEFALAPKEEAEEWANGMQQMLVDVSAAAHPLLVENLDQMKNRSFILRWQNGVDAPMDESFEMYIEVTIRGLESLQRDLVKSGSPRT